MGKKKKIQTNEQTGDNLQQPVPSKSTKSKQSILKFRDFLELQASLLPAVSFAPGSIAFYDTVRTWNAYAIMFPERCADVIVWNEGGALSAVKNDLSNHDQIKVMLQDLSKRKLPNLDESLRSDMYHKEQEKQAVHIQKLQEKSKAAEIANQEKNEPVETQTQSEQPAPSVNPVLDGVNLPPDVIDSLNNSSAAATTQQIQNNPDEKVDDTGEDGELHVPSHIQS